MGKKIYIDYMYDAEKDGPSDGSWKHPFKSTGEYFESTEPKDGDFKFKDLSPVKKPDVSFNWSRLAVWAIILTIAWTLVYVIADALYQATKNFWP